MDRQHIAESAVHVVSVETKYYSSFSSEEDERPEPNDQLARELDNLDAVSPLTYWQRSLLLRLGCSEG